jgi:peptidoglycan LD-endopeptidase LytH
LSNLPIKESLLSPSISSGSTAGNHPYRASRFWQLPGLFLDQPNGGNRKTFSVLSSLQALFIYEPPHQTSLPSFILFLTTNPLLLYFLHLSRLFFCGSNAFMKNFAIIWLLAALPGLSCSSVVHKVFGKETPHEQYAESLDDKGLEDTPEGRQWLAASETALKAPQVITLPYRQEGSFPGDKARALALEFTARQGERIRFELDSRNTPRMVIYADVFKKEGTAPVHVLAADTASTVFSFDVPETGSYILRLQPPLYSTGSYGLAMATGPSLDFPVSGKKATIRSFWGDARDGGKRRHEGLDIFAPKGTPAVAAADGYVTGVKEGGLGGKQVWMKLNDKSIFLYYAHLDKQLVQEGQAVKKGDVLGLIGSTGNARNTPSHLHFGVYTYQGPVDALPFVNRVLKNPPPLAVRNLPDSIKLTRSLKTEAGEWIKANTLAIPLALNAKDYLAELPDGRRLQVPLSYARKVEPSPKPAATLATNPSSRSKGS